MPAEATTGTIGETEAVLELATVTVIEKETEEVGLLAIGATIGVTPSIDHLLRVATSEEAGSVGEMNLHQVNIMTGLRERAKALQDFHCTHRLLA